MESLLASSLFLLNLLQLSLADYRSETSVDLQLCQNGVPLACYFHSGKLQSRENQLISGCPVSGYGKLGLPPIVVPPVIAVFDPFAHAIQAQIRRIPKFSIVEDKPPEQSLRFLTVSCELGLEMACRDLFYHLRWLRRDVSADALVIATRVPWRYSAWEKCELLGHYRTCQNFWKTHMYPLTRAPNIFVYASFRYRPFSVDKQLSKEFYAKYSQPRTTASRR